MARESGTAVCAHAGRPVFTAAPYLFLIFISIIIYSSCAEKETVQYDLKY
jgi:hypothetical protein